ncbi:hypothetical protein C2G38_2199002 [Gigaspora rosea]|uniref:Protein kinase domain-containing protein n=1 Tax=Gigaspora rosea TaxID=44941 RepID=A0A397US70_9GLOM|nr:hypothetical protein C2G38_2199002 [Gigaspora rosea]
MKHVKNKCVNCGKNRKLKPNNLCTSCNSKPPKGICISCNIRVKLYYDNNKLCTDCYHARQILNVVNSGNQDIDNLIKATHNKQLQYRLEWIPFKDFVDIKQIGSGGFSEVYTAKWTRGILICSKGFTKEFNRKENATVVLKVLKDSYNINTAFLKELQNIVKIQPNSDIRQLIQCYGVSQDPNTNNYIFVMPYMSYGSLNEYLSNNFKNVNWHMKRRILREIVTGIKWIHENKIIHRDIHDGNILIDKVKRYDSYYSESFIADLGFSRPAKEDPKNSEIYGIMPYIAPEVFRKKQYSFSSDIYSLGMIMWELTSGCRPFCDRAYDGNLALSICDGSRPEITDDTPQCWAILMQKCWNSEPIKRPSIGEIYNEITSSYWNVTIISTEAENKRQELFKSGKFIAKHMHPHSRTHSKLLTPTIGSVLSSLHRSFRFSMSGSVNFFQNISSDSFNIIPELFKNTSNPNSAPSEPISKKLIIESLSNEEDYKISSSHLNTLPISEAIDKIMSLSNLYLNHDKLSYEAGKFLAESLYTNPTLNYLDLSSRRLCNGAGQGIAMALCNNNTLTNLNLERNYLGDEAGIALAMVLSKNNTLTCLNLKRNRLGYKTGTVLAETLCKNTSLTNLNLERNKLGESVGKAMAEALCKNTTLNNLNLRGNQLGKLAGKALAEALCKNTTLTNLNLSDNKKLGESAGKALAEALCINTMLTNLDLSFNNLGESAGKSLGEALFKNITLTNLDLRSNKLGASAGKALAEALCKNTSLTNLNLGFNKLGESAGKSLAEALCKNTTLTNLGLGGINIDEPAGKALAEALCTNTMLTNLDLSNNELDESTIKVLAEALCKNTTLINLDLKYNLLGDSAGKALAEALCKNTTLINLDLKYNLLGESAGKALAEALCKNTTLTSLDLYVNKLGESGGKSLVEALCKNTTLTKLNLGSNKLGESVEKALVEALYKNTLLTDLDLESNELGESARKALDEAF